MCTLRLVGMSSMGSQPCRYDYGYCRSTVEQSGCNIRNRTQTAKGTYRYDRTTHTGCRGHM
eukprot:scaffold628603_cov24-Prasinocladus_malaysianus.AAC.1